MKAGIKYCGGCNPEYNRGDFVKRITGEFAGQIEFEAANTGTFYDVVLVVSGCRRCCAGYLNLKSRNGWVFIVSDSDYSKLCSILKELV